MASLRSRATRTNGIDAHVHVPAVRVPLTQPALEARACRLPTQTPPAERSRRSDRSSETLPSSRPVRTPFAGIEAVRSRSIDTTAFSVLRQRYRAGEGHRTVDAGDVSLNAIRARRCRSLRTSPRHPRGESYSPCVLICAGGVFPGIIAVDDRQRDRQPGVLRPNRGPEGLQIRLRHDLERPGHRAGDWHRWLWPCGIRLNRHRSAPRPGKKRLRSGRRGRAGTTASATARA